MTKAKQLTVWVPNSPGQIGKIARALAEAGVNLTAFSAHSEGSQGAIRIEVSSHAKARKALDALGVRISEEEVIRLTLPNKPGRLAEVGERLGKAGINVDYACATVTANSKSADVVFAVSDMVGASKALRGL